MAEKQLAIVTGGASGIGFGISEALIKAGYSVVLVGRDEERLATAGKRLGSSAQWRCANVGHRAALERAVSDFDRISLVVNAAGFIRPVSLATPLDEAERDWDAVIDANLKGSFLAAMVAAPKLESPGGSIINISSIGAQTGGSRPGGLAYAAAKAGLHGLTYALARELAPRGITVNAIAPGFIADTGFTGGWPEDRVAEIVAQTPMGLPEHRPTLQVAFSGWHQKRARSSPVRWFRSTVAGAWGDMGFFRLRIPARCRGTNNEAHAGLTGHVEIHILEDQLPRRRMLDALYGRWLAQNSRASMLFKHKTGLMT